MFERRRLMLSVLLAPLSGGPAWAAEPFPSRPIRIVYPGPPGVGLESVIRRIGDELRKQLGQPVIIDNKPGANTQIGITAVAKSAPDGYTLGVGVVTNIALAQHTYKSLPYDPLKDLTAVALLARNYMALVSRPDAPYDTVSSLVRAARASPAGVSVGATSLGGLPHMAFEQLGRMTGIPFTMISYTGNNQIVQDLVGGRLDLAMIDYSSAGPLIDTGKLRLLGITSPERDPRFPKLPTIAETVPGFDSMGWIGIMAPAGTPPDVVELLNARFNHALAQPEVLESMAAFGLIPAPGSPREFAEHIGREYHKFGKLARDIGFKPQ